MWVRRRHRPIRGNGYVYYLRLLVTLCLCSYLAFQILAGIAAGALVVVAAVVLGVVLSRKISSSSSSDLVSGDPSDFAKDSRLKQSFWGIAYTPEGTLYPDCGAKLCAFGFFTFFYDTDILPPDILPPFSRCCHRYPATFAADDSTSLRFTVWYLLTFFPAYSSIRCRL